MDQTPELRFLPAEDTRPPAWLGLAVLAIYTGGAVIVGISIGILIAGHH